MFIKLRNDKFYTLNESELITLFSFYIPFGPYRAVNTLHLGYTNQSVNVV